MDFDEAARSISSVIKEEIGIEASIDHGAPGWKSRSARIELVQIQDGLKVVIYDADNSRLEIHASLTKTDIDATARTIMRKLGQ